MDSITVSSWGEQWQALLEQLGTHFTRRDLRQRATTTSTACWLS